MKKLRSFLGPNGRKFNWSGAWNMSMCVNTQTSWEVHGSVCVCFCDKNSGRWKNENILALKLCTGE